LSASGDALLRNERGGFVEEEEKKEKKVPSGLDSVSLGTFGRYTQKHVARQGPPSPETWDELGVLQLRLAIDGEFWAFPFFDLGNGVSRRERPIVMDFTVPACIAVAKMVL
jgi:hypothetical protein